MKLIIVESPTKAKTINNYAGKDYKVISSKGHIIDLPQKELGIDIDNNFAPKFIPIASKKQIIKSIKDAALKSDDIFIATDPDREGEAIAYHIYTIIGSKKNKNIKRVLFYEITKKGIEKGINDPLDINMSLVNSQYARRIMDRLVGYKISPFLWKSFKKGLSAGRVQSVALRLICEKEEKIKAFKPKQYYKIKGFFKHEKSEFYADLIKYKGVKTTAIKDDENTIRKELADKNYKVLKFTKEKKIQKTVPPFITSTLQQTCSGLYNYSAKRILKIAQSLYEGVEIHGKLTGLITYMRTDSTRISDESVSSIKQLIKDRYGADYLSDDDNKFKVSKNAQDAHEAIRPADISLTPESIEQFLSKEQNKIYSIIWKRTVASQMSNAVYSLSTIDLENEKNLFKAYGNTLIFEGFLKVYPYSKSKDTKNEVPEINEGVSIKIQQLSISREETKPPSRFTEASLIKTLESNGIGRPSTYANIIDIILKREYVYKDKKYFIPSEMGIIVNKILVDYFSEIFNVNFTAEMEKDLDMIEENKMEYVDLLKQFYESFNGILKKAEEKSKIIKKDIQEETDEICEKCGSKMIVKWGRYGKFLACSNYPSCNFTKQMDEQVFQIQEECPECGKDLVVKRGRFGRFIACSNYPECKFTKPFTMGVKCPECNEGEIVEKQSSKGRKFYGCNKYPKCKFATWNIPVPKECPECKNPYMEMKGNKIVCPKCKHEFEEESD